MFHFSPGDSIQSDLLNPPPLLLKHSHLIFKRSPFYNKTCTGMSNMSKISVCHEMTPVCSISFGKMVGGISGIRASVNFPHMGDQAMQIYGNLEGFPLNSYIVWVGVILPDPCDIRYPFYLAGFYRWVLNVNCFCFLVGYIPTFLELHPYISIQPLPPPQKKVHFLELNGSAMADDFSWLTW